MGASSVTAGRWAYVLYGGGGRALAAPSEVMLAQGISPQAPFLTRLRRPQRGPDANGLQIPRGPPLSWNRSQEGSLQDWDLAMHSQGDGRAKQEWGGAESLELGVEGLPLVPSKC